MMTTQRPALAVIVLLYNDMPHGLKAIDSVLAQSYQNFSLYIVDNGSTDSTWESIQHYAANPHIHLIRKLRNIRSGGIQDVIASITEDYISILFSDDVYAPERLAKAMDHFQKNPHDAYVFFNNVFIDQNGGILKTIPASQYQGDISLLSRAEHLQHFIFGGNSLHPCAMIVRTRAYRTCGGFKKFLHRIGDMTFFASLLTHYQGAFLPDRMQYITIWSNQRNESSSNDIPSEQLIAERSYFLSQYTTPAALTMVDEIFKNSTMLPMPLNSRACRIWFFAHQLLIGAASDLRFVGLQLLYQAAAMDDTELQEHILQRTGITLGEYLPTITLPPSRSSSLLRRWLRHFPPARLIYQLMKKIINN